MNNSIMATKFEETVLHGDNVEVVMRAGITKLAAAVKCTLGPCGGFAVLGNTANTKVTKDGVSVAKAFSLPDRWENMAAGLIRDVAVQSEKSAGDGTTTSTVLAEAMVNACYDYLDEPTADGRKRRPVVILKALSNLVSDAKSALKPTARKADTLDELISVANISANAEATGDYALASMSADAVFKTGRYGRVIIKDGFEKDDRLVYQSGYSIERGIHPAMSAQVMNGPIKHDNVLFVCTKMHIETIEQMTAIIEGVTKAAPNMQLPIVIMCGDADDKVVASTSAISNHIRRNIYIVRTPGAGNQSAGLLNDISKMAVCNVLPDSDVSKITNFEQYIGKLKDIVLTESTMLWHTDTDLANYIADLEKLLTNCAQAYDRGLIEERIARLTGGIATIYVGGTTAAELSERKDHFDDATKAVKVAYLDGTVVGGGYALADVWNKLDTDSDKYLGLHDVLLAPHYQILRNAEYTDSEIKLWLTRHFELGAFFNVLLDDLVGPTAYGVVDPLTVVISALDNALSITKLVIGSKVMVGPNANKVSYFG